MAKKNLKWKGDLSVPLKTKVLGPLARPEAAECAMSARWAEINPKLDRLLDHYEIKRDNPQSWFLLSLALAEEFIPGFQEAKSKGRAVKWGMFERGILVVELDRVKKAKTLSIKAAAGVLAKQEPWRSAVSQWEEGKATLGPDAAEALRRVYTAAKKDKFAKAALDAYRYHVAMDSLPAWEALVNSSFSAAERK